MLTEPYRAVQRAKSRPRKYRCLSISTSVHGGVNQRTLCAMKRDFRKSSQLNRSYLWPSNCKEDGIVHFIKDQSSFAKNCIATMEESEVKVSLKQLGSIFVV